jgi:hypothetical protein
MSCIQAKNNLHASISCFSFPFSFSGVVKVEVLIAMLFGEWKVGWVGRPVASFRHDEDLCRSWWSFNHP